MIYNINVQILYFRSGFSNPILKYIFPQKMNKHIKVLSKYYWHFKSVGRSGLFNKERWAATFLGIFITRGPVHEIVPGWGLADPPQWGMIGCAGRGEVGSWGEGLGQLTGWPRPLVSASWAPGQRDNYIG